MRWPKVDTQIKVMTVVIYGMFALAAGAYIALGDYTCVTWPAISALYFTLYRRANARVLKMLDEKNRKWDKIATMVRPIPGGERL